MLNITLTPTTLTFNDLSDEMLDKLSKTYGDYEWRVTEKATFVKGSPQKLYKLLLELTYTYDIELT